MIYFIAFLFFVLQVFSKKLNYQEFDDKPQFGQTIFEWSPQPFVFDNQIHKKLYLKLNNQKLNYKRKKIFLELDLQLESKQDGGDQKTPAQILKEKLELEKKQAKEKKERFKTFMENLKKQFTTYPQKWYKQQCKQYAYFEPYWPWKTIDFILACDPFMCPQGKIYNIDYAMIGKHTENHGSCPNKIAGASCNFDVAGKLLTAIGQNKKTFRMNRYFDYGLEAILKGVPNQCNNTVDYRVVSVVFTCQCEKWEIWPENDLLAVFETNQYWK